MTATHEGPTTQTGTSSDIRERRRRISESQRQGVAVWVKSEGQATIAWAPQLLIAVSSSLFRGISYNCVGTSIIVRSLVFFVPREQL